MFRVENATQVAACVASTQVRATAAQQACEEGLAARDAEESKAKAARAAKRRQEQAQAAQEVHDARERRSAVVRAEVAGLKMSALKKRARKLGVSEAALDDADDEAVPRDAVVAGS